MGRTFYDFSAQDIQGNEVPMQRYEGKVVLVVNTASDCGFTPQLEGLQELYDRYEPKGFVVLGFPCNQFGAQEPGEEAAIANGCVVNYGVGFPLFSKIEVNGSEAHPLFNFLKGAKGGLLSSRIKWNFTKFLIDRTGNPVKRFAPITKPQRIAAHIERLL